MNKITKKELVSFDGNTAAGYIGYAMSEVASIYPITPSSPMAEYNDEIASNGKQNVFGDVVRVVEMQSEAGAAGTVHGSLCAGALTVTYTASQGLLLMIPNMFKIAGELLPTVFHVSARTIASHALNIFGDHSDVMSCRQTGFCMLASNNVQEVMDLALISHIASLKSSLPFLHFFDGFRTSHEINKIEKISYEVIRKMLPLKEIQEFKNNSHNPDHPKETGTAQNTDIFFQNREACNKYYDRVYGHVVNVMKEFETLTGRKYSPFQYVGSPTANNIIVIMCSGADTVESTTNYLNKQGKKYGVLKVRLYRPFNAQAFVDALPKTVKNITVLDRTKEPGCVGEPLYTDIISALKECGKCCISVLSGRYGLGGKDFVPADVASVYENMIKTNPINHFTVSIKDDVTKLSLPAPKEFTRLEDNCYECKFFGLGSDGTVSANKSSIKIIGAQTSKFTQGYFEYDSKKSGSLTTSHLRVSDDEIKMPYFVREADFIAIHNYAFIHTYDLLDGIKKNGKILINTSLTEEQLSRDLPQNFKDHLKSSKAKLFIIPANKVALASGLRNRINVIMQACFFKISNVIDYKLAEKEMKDSAIKVYGKKGDAVIQANIKGIDAATIDLKEVDVEKLINTPSDCFSVNKRVSSYYTNWVQKVETRKGDNMLVSEFNADGSVPTDTTQYEKRGIGLNVSTWASEYCIQCGQCTLVCPHAAMRPYLLDEKQKNSAASTLQTRPAIGIPGLNYCLQVSPLDCTGCESCVRVCPAKTKALVMKPLHDVKKIEVPNYEFCHSLETHSNIPFKPGTVKGSQFLKPYFEFSGACAGCGETPYVKLVTQLFGKNMVIANATGCSSIYGGSAPSCPYSKDKDGCGPSWANSLFEDNAEFGYGMHLAFDFRQKQAYGILNKLTSSTTSDSLKTAIREMDENKSGQSSNEFSKKLLVALTNEKTTDESVKSLVAKAITNADMYSKKSVWIFGGDGWAYDIGYGGLDHILASGQNINVLVLDTEVYSNTGGQSSKATPMGSVAKFAASGKSTRKKDLGVMLMTYKDVYVAHVSMGANPQQFINAIVEAESYDGPSIVIAYAPCINHGIDMSGAQAEMKKAVTSGYWNLYRYDPRKTENPLTIDSAEPTISYQDFLMGENRYVSLMKKDPENAQKLFDLAAQHSKERRETLKQLATKLAVSKKGEQ